MQREESTCYIMSGESAEMRLPSVKSDFLILLIDEGKGARFTNDGFELNAANE